MATLRPPPIWSRRSAARAQPYSRCSRLTMSASRSHGGVGEIMIMGNRVELAGARHRFINARIGVFAGAGGVGNVAHAWWLVRWRDSSGAKLAHRSLSAADSVTRCAGKCSQLEVWATRPVASASSTSGSNALRAGRAASAGAAVHARHPACQGAPAFGCQCGDQPLAVAARLPGKIPACLHGYRSASVPAFEPAGRWCCPVIPGPASVPATRRPGYSRVDGES